MLEHMLLALTLFLTLKKADYAETMGALCGPDPTDMMTSERNLLPKLCMLDVGAFGSRPPWLTGYRSWRPQAATFTSSDWRTIHLCW